MLPQRTFPGQGEVREAGKAAPEGDTSAAGHMGEQAPMETDDGAVLDSAHSGNGSGDPCRPGV